MGVDSHWRKLTKIVILQPSFLPWLGYFDQYDWADTFVIYDDTKFDKHGWRNRNRILSPTGVQWLTVPVRTKGRMQPLNTEITIANERKWAKKLTTTLRQSYSNQPYFKQYFPQLESILNEPYSRLINLNLNCLRWLIESLGLPQKFVLSSQLSGEGQRTRRLIAICRELKATDYLSGNSAQNYIDKNQFQAANIRLHWHNYQHPVYQQGTETFHPYLSTVDLLFRQGPQSLQILCQNRRAYKSI